MIAQKIKEKLALKKFLIFQEMELPSPKLKNVLHSRRELANAKKQTKKSALKKFLFSCNIFAMFTPVRHKEISCEAENETEM